MKAINDLLGAGATSIDPELGSVIAGHGGPLRVLYVTGDYYDINAVWQTNIISDVNVMYRCRTAVGRSAGASSRRGRDAVGRHGNNQLTNDAAIVDVNPDATYVNGHVYTDCILVQAELVPANHQDAAVNADTDALVTELIAFVDDNQDHSNSGSSHVSLTVQG